MIANHGRPVWLARLATSGVFFANGMTLALFFSNIPQFRDGLHLTEAQLGTALAFQGVGTVVCVVMAGLIASRIGTRLTMLTGAILMAVAAQAVGHAWNMVSFSLAIVALGSFNCLVDVSMNAHGCLIEREWRAEILPSFHAAYNLGGFSGAALASVLLTWRYSLQSAMTMAGVIMIVVVVVGYVPLGNLSGIGAEQESGPVDRKSLFASLRNPTVAILGVFVALAFFVENGMNGWSSIYLHDVAHVDPAGAAKAFAIFQLALFGGRIIGGWTIRRLGPRGVLVVGGVLACVGNVLLITNAVYWAVVVGFAAIGAGLANCAPMFFTRAAAAVPSSPAVGLALVNTIGYCGFVGGPLVLGIIAQLAGLKLAFMAIGLAMAIIAISGKLLENIKSSAELSRHGATPQL